MLSQNVANADTPGYAARDLKPLDFEDVLKGATTPAQFAGGMPITDPRHIALDAGTRSDFDRLRRARRRSQSRAATRCRWKQEMIKVSDTQAAVPGRRPISTPRRIDMMKTAIGTTG